MVEGDYIGTDPAGDNRGNGQNGVLIENAASINSVGGSGAFQGNVIAGSGQSGVRIDGSQTRGNNVVANWIGTDQGSRLGIGNSGDGVKITGGATYNIIGGQDTSAGNVIANNAGKGVYISGATFAIVEANYIGTDRSSAVNLGNQQDGVLLDNSAMGSQIGVNGASPLAAQRNVISGNLGNGVHITGSATTLNSVAGNYIGIDPNGSLNLGNDLDGVLLDGERQFQPYWGQHALGRPV